MSFHIEYIDKALTDNLTFTLRFRHTCKLCKELFAGIHANYIQPEAFVIVHHILELILTEHTVVYEDTSQILTDSSIQQNSSNR